MYAGATLSIDAEAIAANTRLIASRTDAELMAVVKADGFGHGNAGLVALENGATWLGVTSIDEALPLRWRGVTAPILSWLNAVDSDVESAIRRDIDLAVPSVPHLQAIARAAGQLGRPAWVHLHVDTGMSRDGIAPAEWSALCELTRLAQDAGLVRVRGIMSHLARADEPEHAMNLRQTLAFDNAVGAAHRRGIVPRYRHLAATAAALTAPRTHYDLVRVGAGLFGIDPSGSTELHGAMTLTAPVTAVREVRAGASVGYGGRYTVDRDTRLALLPIGYADGIPRSLSPGAEVLVRDRRLPIAGAVSMDQLVIDVGDLGVQPGEVATLFGPGTETEPTLAEWADWSGTIEHELVTRIGPRVARTRAAAA